MQVKIVIGTVAFMLTMIILGFAVLREPTRLEEFSESLAGRSIENGASTFQTACATCHGVDGKAQECVSTSGEPTTCIGRPLNHPPLLCSDPSPRMEELQWSGTKRNLIYSTVSAGRAGTLMPAWSQEFGGPLQQNEIEDVTAYVLNWQTDELCAGPVVVEAPWPVEGWPESVDEIAEGDAAAGAQAFIDSACNTCHGDPATPGGNPIGPHLGNIGNAGGTRVEGKSARQYIYESILSPNLHIAPDCPTGPCSSPSAMPPTFPTQLTPEEMSNLLAYLMQQQSGQ